MMGEMDGMKEPRMMKKELRMMGHHKMMKEH
jgi:hypothetical protein